MKSAVKTLLLFCLTLILALSVTTNASAKSLDDDRTILGSSYTLESGNIHNGDLNVIGGLVTIKQNAEVRGDMFVLGGLVDMDGILSGNLTVLGGSVNLGETAVIEGNLVSPGSFINKDAQAVIKGSQSEGFNLPWGSFPFPQFPHTTSFTRTPIRVMPFVNRLVSGTATALLMAALGALLLLVIPQSAERMTLALSAQPFHALGFGALTALVMLIGGILLTITICLIPVVILAGLSFGLAVLAGWLTLGYALGKQIESNIFKSKWHPVLTAVLGNLVLYVFTRALDLIPCIGGFLVFVASLFGLGLVVITLFGTRDYPRNSQTSQDEQIILSPQQSAESQPVLEPEILEASPADSIQAIEELNLTPRTLNTLKAAGFLTVEDVLTHLKAGKQAMLSISGFGPKSMEELLTALQSAGFVSHNEPDNEQT